MEQTFPAGWDLGRSSVIGSDSFEVAYLLPASLEGMELLSSTERPNPHLDFFRKRLDALPTAIA